MQLIHFKISLLNCLLAKLHLIDPDALVGHNITGFELDLLISRMKVGSFYFYCRQVKINEK